MRTCAFWQRHSADVFMRGLLTQGYRVSPGDQAQSISISYESDRKYQSKCVIVLPCFNEERNLRSLISRIDRAVGHAMPYQIIAVDDGSTDGTRDILRQLSIECPIAVLEHKTNIGLAGALRTGLNAAMEVASDDDFVVTVDADNTHDPCLILDMIEMCRRGVDLVISSRYVAGGGQIGVPFHRVVLSRGINFLLRLKTGLNIRDFTSGYRCYRLGLIRRLLSIYQHQAIESEGFEVALELLAKSMNLSAKAVEIPMVLNYSRKKGKSNIKIRIAMLRYARFLLRPKMWDIPVSFSQS